MPAIEASDLLNSVNPSLRFAILPSNFGDFGSYAMGTSVLHPIDPSSYSGSYFSYAEVVVCAVHRSLDLDLRRAAVFLPPGTGQLPVDARARNCFEIEAQHHGSRFLHSQGRPADFWRAHPTPDF